MKRELKLNKLNWINISNASDKDVLFLKEQFKFHPLALEDCLSNIQRPKVDDYENYLFMVFHLPRYLKKYSRTVALELNIFLGKDYLITLHNGDLKPLNHLFDGYQAKPSAFQYDNPTFLLYEILNNSFNYCFPMLDKVGQKLDKIEDDLYEDQSRKTLEEISLIAQDIINFRRVISPQRYFIKDLEQIRSKFITEKLEIYFDDIADKIERIWDSLNNFKEVCDVLQRTNESILTQRLNEIMKVLTIFSVIMLPLTVITGFYGMNVAGLPFAGHNLAAEIVSGILILVILSMLFYFNRKKWL